MTERALPYVCPADHERWAALSDGERDAWRAGHEWGYRDGESNAEDTIDTLREQISELRELLRGKL